MRHRLFSALTHVVNRGLRDFALPIDILLSAIATCEVTGALLREGSLREVNQPDQVAFGYRDRSASEVLPIGRALRPALVHKLLLYVAYCLTGRRFPRGSLINVPTSLSTSPQGPATTVEHFFIGTLAAETGSVSLLPPLLPSMLQVSHVIDLLNRLTGRVTAIPHSFIYADSCD